MKVPTVEEFIIDFNQKVFATQDVVWTRGQSRNALIEFAKLHVEAALKATHGNMQLPEEDLEFTLNSYPLDLIK